MSSTNATLFYKTIPENSFDLLRLIFAGIVVISHFMTLSGVCSLSSKTFYFDTTVAVMGFFILSGYLILASFLKQDDLKVYYNKRARRLLPAYFFIIWLCALAFSLISTESYVAYFSDPGWRRYVGYNMLFLNFLQPSLPGVFDNNPLNNAVNGSLWTIKIEVIFYLSIPVWVYIFRKLNQRFYILFFLIFLYAFSLLYEFFVGELVKNRPGLSSLMHQFPAMLKYFSVGMAAYLFGREKYFTHPYVVILGVLLFSEKFIFNSTYFWPLGLGILIFFIGFSLKGLAFKLLRGNDYSYGIYLFHYPIAQLLISLGIFNMPYIYSFSIYLGAVSTTAYFSWHCIEKKFVYRKKRHLQ